MFKPIRTLNAGGTLAGLRLGVQQAALIGFNVRDFIKAS
jgi:hypothetical protein